MTFSFKISTLRPNIKIVFSDVKPSVIRNWQRFIDFILRHLSQITLSYESWAAEEETLFCAALEFIEKLEGAALSLSDLKKMAKKLKELKGLKYKKRFRCAYSSKTES